MRLFAGVWTVECFVGDFRSMMSSIRSFDHSGSSAVALLVALWFSGVFFGDKTTRRFVSIRSLRFLDDVWTEGPKSEISYGMTTQITFLIRDRRRNTLVRGSGVFLETKIVRQFQQFLPSIFLHCSAFYSRYFNYTIAPFAVAFIWCFSSLHL